MDQGKPQALRGLVVHYQEWCQVVVVLELVLESQVWLGEQQVLSSVG